MSLRIGEAEASAYSFVVTQVKGFVKEKYFKSLRLESEKKTFCWPGEESSRFLTYPYVPESV